MNFFKDEVSPQKIDISRLYGGILFEYCMGIVSKGYFIAPKASTYKFTLISHKNISVYASKFKGSS